MVGQQVDEIDSTGLSFVQRGADQWTIGIGTDFKLVSPDRTYIVTDDEAPPAALEALSRATVESCFVSRWGVLTVRFHGGAWIEVEPHEKYEAWEIHGPRGLHVLCLGSGSEPLKWDANAPSGRKWSGSRAPLRSNQVRTTSPGEGSRAHDDRRADCV
jgi:Family of unknown function (DUF6188)